MAMQKSDRKPKYEETDLVLLDIYGEILSFDEVLDRILNAVDEGKKRKFATG